MTGRFSRRIAQVHDIAQSIIDSHPLTEIVDSSTPCNETLDSDSDVATSRTETALSWAAKRENYASIKINTSHPSIIFSECNSTGGTSRTLSTDSWCDDEFEKENTKKVRNILENIDHMIYERKMLDELNSEVQDECQLWAKKFPCLRILGKQILQSEDDGIQFHLPMINLEDKSKADEVISFYAKDLQLPILPLTDKELVFAESESNHLMNADIFDHECQNHGNSTNFIEETIAQHGQYEEYLACHNSGSSENLSEDDSSSQKTPLNDLNVELIRERVLDKLMERLWPELLSLWQLIKDEQNSDEKAGIIHKKSLPSLTLTPKSSDIKRTREYSSLHHPLDGILMVSSKVLQKRDHRFSGELGVVTRPGSSLTSPHRAVSRHSTTSSIQDPPFFRNSMQHGGSNLPSVPNSRTSSAVRRLGRYINRDIEWCEALQCLQEESDILPNVENSDEQVQQHFSDEVDENIDSRFPTSHFSLPPIIDANSISTKQSIRSPVSPVSVENTLLDRITNSQLYRNDKIDSRPNTCISTRSMMGQRNKNVKNLDFPPADNPPDVPILGGLSSKLLSPNIQKEIGPQLPFLGSKFTPERLVTLFPIIKSVELQKQSDNKKTSTRRNQSAKRAGHHSALNQLKR